jgi:hypothetical protein
MNEYPSFRHVYGNNIRKPIQHMIFLYSSMTFRKKLIITRMNFKKVLHGILTS